jgi:hypothetical protein
MRPSVCRHGDPGRAGEVANPPCGEGDVLVGRRLRRRGGDGYHAVPKVPAVVGRVDGPVAVRPLSNREVCAEQQRHRAPRGRCRARGSPDGWGQHGERAVVDGRADLGQRRGAWPSARAAHDPRRLVAGELPAGTAIA